MLLLQDRMSPMISRYLLAVLLVAAALGADVSGKWRAEFTSPDGQQRVNTFMFKSEDGKLTGTVAGSQDEPRSKTGSSKVMKSRSRRRDRSAISLTRARSAAPKSSSRSTSAVRASKWPPNECRI